MLFNLEYAYLGCLGGDLMKWWDPSSHPLASPWPQGPSSRGRKVLLMLQPQNLSLWVESMQSADPEERWFAEP